MYEGRFVTSWLRIEAHGFKLDGVMGTRWHFHLPWGPGMEKHHLPYQFENWWNNFKAYYGF